MLIVTQNKDCIVNLDLVSSIFIKNERDIIAECPHIEDYWFYLGKYKTNERAKEILNEMMLRICDWENLKAGQPTGICNPVYEMPRE